MGNRRIAKTENKVLKGNRKAQIITFKLNEKVYLPKGYYLLSPVIGSHRSKIKWSFSTNSFYLKENDSFSLSSSGKKSYFNGDFLFIIN